MGKSLLLGLHAGIKLPAVLHAGLRSWARRKHGGDFADFAQRLETRVGKIPLSGRYHKLPRQIEDDYEVTSTVLGAGYSGDVLMAMQKGGHGQQKFAVKVLQLPRIRQCQLEQLKSEVENFLTTDHPHITRLYDVYESKDSLHLVMECMEGGELFDRVSQMKRFPEQDAVEALWQMLLAVNYIHSHGIVHRDLKLENFLYDERGSSHLKLIDFGFSKMWDPSCVSKMDASLGTVAYVAPEVLRHSYTNQCDMWSLGVISFILLSGYMPFGSSDTVQTRNILAGRYRMKPEKWAGVSQDAVHFMRSLLEVDPQTRLTAQQALEHPWIARRRQDSGVDEGVVKALQQFGQESKFRRCCMEMIAWSLSNEERAKVCEHFISLDTTRQGTITLEELRRAMESLGVSDEEVLRVFLALDTNQDQEIHYSDFLAAMVSTKIDLNEDLMCAAFRKFDADGSGCITVDNLRQILGDTFEGEHVEDLLRDAQHTERDRITYSEFVAYLSRHQPRRPPAPVEGDARHPSSPPHSCPTTAGEPSVSRRRERWPTMLRAGSDSLKAAWKGLSSSMICQGILPH